MKICVLGTRGFPGVQGGIESHCENLYPRLVKRGCDVTAFAREPYVDSRHLNFQEVKIVPIRCPQTKYGETIIHTAKGVLAAKKTKCDLLHLHAIGPSLLAPLARLFGMRVILTHHGPDYKRKKWNLFARLFLRFCEFAGVMSAHQIIAVSQDIANGLKRKYGKNAHVIPNGVTVHAPLQTTGILEKYGLKSGAYILAVARFVPEKGLHVLVESFGRLNNTGWKLVIAGQSDHEDKYSRELKKKALENPNVVLTGFLKDQALAEIYSHAGVFAMPSYYEGLPIALLEALSYGLSCIASDIPPHQHVGLAPARLVTPGDSRMLTEKLRAFIEKPLKPEEKAAQIRFISAAYDWESIADQTMGVYHRGLEKEC